MCSAHLSRESVQSVCCICMCVRVSFGIVPYREACKDRRWVNTLKYCGNVKGVHNGTAGVIICLSGKQIGCVGFFLHWLVMVPALYLF